MFNNKYSKLLTVILIVAILAIIVLLAIKASDIFKGSITKGETDEVVSKFEEEVNKLMNTENGTIYDNSIPSENVEANTIIDTPGGVDVNAIFGDNTINNGNNNGDNNTSGGNNGVITKYKGYDVIGIIEIPKTNVKLPIVKQEDVSVNSLNVAICNLYGELNKEGDNAVLVGHNFRNGTFFSNNKKLVNGDKIYITDSTGKKVTYTVKKKYETSSGDFDYATRQVATGKREISLSTCTDDSKKRLIIWAED